MERRNRLSDNLRQYQRARGETLAEFSEELGIARSTIQSILVDGNTTVDTLIRMANALNISLDELVFGEPPAAAPRSGEEAPDAFRRYSELPPEAQNRLRRHLNEIFELLRPDE